MQHLISALRRSENLVVRRTTQSDLTIYNYTKDSPKFCPAHRQARGTVLDKNYNLVARGFERFFNVGESIDRFNWDNYTVQEKIDGYFMLLYSWPDWRVNTRINFAEEKSMFGGPKWAEVFWRHTREPNVHRRTSLAFELVGRKIVRDYPEGLYLIGGWDNHYGVELTDYQLDKLAEEIGVGRPYIFSASLNELREILKDKEKTDPTFEGYVLKDNRNVRLKLKSKSYLSLQYLSRGDINSKRIVELYESDNLDEVIVNFPELELEKYRDHINQIKSYCQFNCDKYKDLSQKEFALLFKDDKYFSGLMGMRNGQFRIRPSWI